MEFKIDIKEVHNKERVITKTLKTIGKRCLPKVTIDSNGILTFKYANGFITGKMIVKQANKNKYKHINQFLEKFYRKHINSNKVWMLYKVIECENHWLFFFIKES